MGLTILDTSILIDHLRGRGGALDAFRDALLGGEDMAASVVTKAEVLAGMRSPERHRTKTLLDAVRWIDLENDDAELAGEFARLYRRSHQSIDLPDYLIAATAYRRDAELWTTNVKHFPMFEDLAPPY